MTRLGGRISFLQLRAHRLLVQPYLIQSTISCVQATMSSPHFPNAIGALKDRWTIRRDSNWRIAQSIRQELFLQQYPGPKAINLHINVLLPPHCYMENRRSHLDYPRRQHIMLQPRATCACKGNRLPLCLDVCTDGYIKGCQLL